MTKNIYKLFLDMKIEIDKHKWIESEKEGKDIGFESALVDWMSKYRNDWAKHKFNNVINET
jgi:hypothetical protein